jgi:urease accessory protein
VGPHARAFLSTQASTKVYRSPHPSCVELEAHLAAGAQLVVWPDPVVCFAGSSYRQRQAFEVEQTAALVVVDWMTSGRRASGERWQFDRYDTHLTVAFDGRRILLDAVSLSADEGELSSRMGRFDVLCTAALVGLPLRSQIDRLMADIAAVPFQRRPDMLIAVAPLSDVGCLLRIAGPSVESVAGLLREQLSFVAGLLGDDPWARKW